MTTDELKQLLTELSMNQKTVAEALGVEASTVSRWLSGAVAIPKIAELAVQHLRCGEMSPTIVQVAEDSRAMYASQETLTNSQAAAYVGAARRTFLDWVTRGLIPKPVVGYRYDGKQKRRTSVFLRADLDAFLAKDSERMGRRRLQ